jgi:hypothetical protein
MNKSYKKTGFLRIESDLQCMPPDWYGIAYIDYMRNKAICYPVGLNWLVWLFRELHYIIKYTPISNKLLRNNKIIVGYFTDYNKTYFDIICVAFNKDVVVEKLKENAIKTGRTDLAELSIFDFIE